MFKLEFDTDSAAFDEILLGRRAEECTRILRKIAGRIERGSVAGFVQDINGNVIGRYEWESD